MKETKLCNDCAYLIPLVNRLRKQGISPEWIAKQQFPVWLSVCVEETGIMISTYDEYKTKKACPLFLKNISRLSLEEQLALEDRKNKKQKEKIGLILGVIAIVVSVIVAIRLFIK